MTGLSSGNFTSAGTSVFDSAAATLTMTSIGMLTTDTVTFTAPGSVPLHAQSFTIDLVYNFTSAAAVNGTSTITANAGSWTAEPIPVPAILQW